MTTGIALTGEITSNSPIASTSCAICQWISHSCIQQSLPEPGVKKERYTRLITYTALRFRLSSNASELAARFDFLFLHVMLGRLVLIG